MSDNVPIIDLKWCPTCQAVKPGDAFGRSADRLDGRAAVCKPCRSEKARAKHAADPSAARTRSHNYYWSNREKVKERARTHRKKYGEKVRGTEAQKARQRRSAQAYKLAHPDRVKARQVVADAIKTGRLIRPDRCSDCGAVGPVEFDHTHGYEPENQLVGQFVCKKCHWKAEYARRAR